MRLVEHLAVERCSTRARSKRRDDILGMRNVGRRRREGRIDRLDLIGMDRQHSGETLALRQARSTLQALGVAEVGMERLDRIDARRLRRDKDQCAYHLMDEEEFA